MDFLNFLFILFFSGILIVFLALDNLKFNRKLSGRWLDFQIFQGMLDNPTEICQM